MSISKDTRISTKHLQLIAKEEMYAETADVHPHDTEAGTHRLVHELEVNQIELELQNSELRQSRYELETALEKYTDLYDFAPVSYFTLDRNGIISAVNLAGANLLQADRSHLVGQNFKHLISIEYRHAFSAYLKAVLTCQEKESCEATLQNRQNRPVVVQIEAVASASGHEFRLALIDITERKQLETEIQDAREYAENIVETVREPLVVLNSDLKILTANQSFYETFKVTPAETIGNFIYDLGNRQWDIPKLRVLFEEILPHDTVFNGYEVEHDFQGIGRKTILLNARQIFRKNIGSHIILLAMENITERKQLETEIQDAREYAENIVETVREPLVVLNANLKILTANHSFYDTFKVTPLETIGNFIYDLGNRQWDIPKLRILFEEILHYHSVFNGYEVEHDFQGIGRKIILLNARQIFRENIGSHIILLAMEDITERKRLEEDLQEAHDKLELILGERTNELIRAHEQQQEIAESNRRLEEVSKTKSDFLANMSHELRTPLNSVIGFSEVLQDQMFGLINDKQQEYVTNILTSGRHLLSLINDILDLSKVESGKMQLELSEFSLREAVEASLMMLREKALKGGIGLHMHLAPQADVNIVADQRKLKQILFNLLSNAVKFTPPPGTVDVHVGKSGNVFQVTVADTGMGIKEEDIPKLFQAFTQLESVYTKEYEGTGLGLALTRQLVELHGGRIWVNSDFGSGSKFSFTIPHVQATTLKPPPLTSVNQGRQP